MLTGPGQQPREAMAMLLLQAGHPFSSAVDTVCCFLHLDQAAPLEDLPDGSFQGEGTGKAQGGQWNCPVRACDVP